MFLSEYDAALARLNQGEKFHSVKNVRQIVPGLKMLSQAVHPRLAEVLSLNAPLGTFKARVTTMEGTYKMSFSLYSWIGADIVEDPADRESELIEQAELLAEWTGARELLEAASA